MSKIAIVTDSTANLTAVELNKYDNISVIPLFFIFGEETFLDGTISQSDFFKKVDTLYDEKKILPTTSQPSIGTTTKHFEGLLNEGYDHVIYITLSSGLSGTYQNGVLGAKEFENKVTVIDSLSASAILKVMVLKAANLAIKQREVSYIVNQVGELINNNYIFLAVDDLAHLKRTGRISAAESVIGSLIKLKPILELEKGKIYPIDKVRSLSKAHKSIMEKALALDITKHDYVAIAHAFDIESASKIKQHLDKKLKDIEVEIVELSPVISTHTGRGSVGITVVKNYYL